MLRFILSALAALSTASAAPVSAADQCAALPLPFEVPADLATDFELASWLQSRAIVYCLQPTNAATVWCSCYQSGAIDVAGL